MLCKKVTMSQDTSHKSQVKLLAMYDVLSTMYGTDLSIKARAVSRMTSYTILAHLNQQRIHVAVIENFFYKLIITRCRSLYPVFFSGTRPETSLTRLYGPAK